MQNEVQLSNDEVKETRSRERTRARLLEAALTVFAEHGVPGASIEIITEAAGFTRGAFYSNFESKEELFFELSEVQGAEALTKLKATVAELSSRFASGEVNSLSKEGISRLVDAILTVQFSEPRWYIVQIEFKLFALRDREAAKQLLRTQDKFFAEVSRVVESALDAVGLEFTIDPAVASSVLIHSYITALETAILNDRRDIVQAAQKIAMRSLPELVNSLTRPKHA
ncbi:MAG: TetR family transcriptional regulator [Microbacteriaceae bacterium]